jgi:ABC-type branched-subunit amino acid transport system ATPase component
MLTVAELSLAYGDLHALRSVSLSAMPGSILGLVGPNGSGKSTLLNIVAGVQLPDSGTVALDGRKLHLGRPDLVARQGIGRTFQMPRLARRLTVFQNMLVGAAAQPGESLLPLLFRPGAVRRCERALASLAWDVLRRVDLAHKANDYAGDLSGGQQKLLSMGMLLMGHPRVLLLDEPAAGVNPALIERQVALLRALRDEGRIIVLVEHNMEMLSDLCDRVVVRDAGEVIAEGTPAEIRADVRVMRSYLGEPT